MCNYKENYFSDVTGIVIFIFENYKLKYLPTIFFYDKNKPTNK